MKKENARESFVFYRSFYEAIKNLPAENQAEILSALMEYALNGNEPENMSPVARGYMILMRPQIDANNRRYNNGCRPKRKNGTKSQPDTLSDTQSDDSTGHMPEVDFEPVQLPEAEPAPDTDVVQAAPVQPEGQNDDILTDEESARFQLLFPHTHRNREFLFFIKWMKNNVPYCVSAASWSHGITESEYERLRQKYKYSAELIAKTVAEIANRRDLRDKYDNFYLTLLNWLKKSHTAA